MRASRLCIVLAILNFLNAVLPTLFVVNGLLASLVSYPTPPEFGGSAARIEFWWWIFVALATAGMLGLSICLLLRPNRAPAAAFVAVLLLALEAAMLFPIAGMDHESMGGGMLLFIGLPATGLFALVPTGTLILLLTVGRRDAPSAG